MTSALDNLIVNVLLKGKEKSSEELEISLPQLEAIYGNVVGQYKDLLPYARSGKGGYSETLNSLSRLSGLNRSTLELLTWDLSRYFFAAIRDGRSGYSCYWSPVLHSDGQGRKKLLAKLVNCGMNIEQIAEELNYKPRAVKSSITRLGMNVIYEYYHKPVIKPKKRRGQKSKDYPGLETLVENPTMKLDDIGKYYGVGRSEASRIVITRGFNKRYKELRRKPSAKN